MPKALTFVETRDVLGTYDGTTLGWFIIDEDGLEAASSLMTRVSDFVPFLIDGDPRGDIDAIRDYIDGTDESRLIRDPLSTVPTADTTGTTPAMVCFYDKTGATDADHKMVAALECIDIGPGFDGWEIDPAAAIALITPSTGIDDRLGALAARTVAGVPFTAGDVDAETLADALDPFIDGGGGSGGPSTNVLRLCDPTNTDHDAGAYITDPLGDFTTGWYSSGTINAVSPGASGDGTFSEVDTETHDGLAGEWDNRERAKFWWDGIPWDYVEWTEIGGSTEAHTFYAAPNQPGWIETGWRPAAGVPWRTAVNLIFDNGAGEFEVEFLRAPRKDEATDVTRDGEDWVYQAHIIPGTTPGVPSAGPTSIDTGVNGHTGIGMGTGLLVLEGELRIKDGSEGTLKAAPSAPGAAGQDAFGDGEGNTYTPGDTAACVAANDFVTEVLTWSAAAAAALNPPDRSYLLDLSGEAPGAHDIDLSTIPPWVENLSVLSPSGGPSTLTLVDPPATYDRRTLTFFTITMDGSALTFVNGFSGTFGPSTTGISGVLIPTPLGYIFVTAN